MCLVKFRNGNYSKFKEFESGIYYHDTKKYDDDKAVSDTYKTKQSVNRYPMLKTVDNNKECLTRQEIEGVDRAQKHQTLLGFPSTYSFIYYVVSNLMINCDITMDDIKQTGKNMAQLHP